jgi:hypothetical protein
MSNRDRTRRFFRQAMALVGAGLLALGLASPAAAQYSRAPADQSALDRWSKRSNLTRAMVRNDPSSPVWHKGNTGPKYNVTSHLQAVRNLAKYTGTVFAGAVTMERLDPWTRFDGRDARIALAPTRIGGKPGTLFALVVQPRGSDGYAIWALDMPTQTYREWGGAVRMMALRDVIDSATIFPADMRRQIAQQTHREQLAFYEAALAKLYTRLSARYAMSRSQQILRMQELNYDLLFGGDISSPFIAD